LVIQRKRPKRNKAAKLRQPNKLALHINHVWIMDFVANNLFDGRKFRMLTVADCNTRESLDIHFDQRLKCDDVVQVLNNILAIRGKPMTVKTDNGSKFINKVTDKWAYKLGIELGFNRPSKSTDNSMEECFNRRLRQECLNEH
jgi:putative transposase